MLVFFFFNDTATTEIYTLSLHDALPICEHRVEVGEIADVRANGETSGSEGLRSRRSEEHTSELQSQSNLVCRLLLEKKKKIQENGCTDKLKQIHQRRVLHHKTVTVASQH